MPNTSMQNPIRELLGTNTDHPCANWDSWGWRRYLGTILLTWERSLQLPKNGAHARYPCPYMSCVAYIVPHCRLSQLLPPCHCCTATARADKLGPRSGLIPTLERKVAAAPLDLRRLHVRLGRPTGSPASSWHAKRSTFPLGSQFAPLQMAD